MISKKKNNVAQPKFSKYLYKMFLFVIHFVKLIFGIAYSKYVLTSSYNSKTLTFQIIS